jgi:hypothetical protein
VRAGSSTTTYRTSIRRKSAGRMRSATRTSFAWRNGSRA